MSDFLAKRIKENAIRMQNHAFKNVAGKDLVGMIQQLSVNDVVDKDLYRQVLNIRSHFEKQAQQYCCEFDIKMLLDDIQEYLL